MKIRNFVIFFYGDACFIQVGLQVEVNLDYPTSEKCSLRLCFSSMFAVEAVVATKFCLSRRRPLSLDRHLPS